MSTEAWEVHKFDSESGLTWREVFDFAFTQNLIPRLEALSRELDRGELLGAMSRAGYAAAVEQGREAAKSILSNDFEAYKAQVREVFSLPLYRGAQVAEFVEDSSRAIEVRVRECLWEKTFREAGATDWGYAALCCTDIGFWQGFDPRVRLTRTKCLMQGDDCCNHRWALED